MKFVHAMVVQVIDVLKVGPESVLQFAKANYQLHYQFDLELLSRLRRHHSRGLTETVILGSNSHAFNDCINMREDYPPQSCFYFNKMGLWHILNCDVRSGSKNYKYIIVGRLMEKVLDNGFMTGLFAKIQLTIIPGEH